MRHRRNVDILVFLAVVLHICFCFAVSSVNADVNQGRSGEQQSGIVKKIEVSGNRRISSMIILARIKTKEGEPLSKEIVRQDIKNIYESGYFSNISVDATPFEEGLKVTYIVSEKPYVEKIEIIGNHVLETEEIDRVMSLSSGDIYLKRTLEEDIKRITELYEKKGYYKTEITYKVDIKEEEKKVAIVININEGPRTKVKRIQILGNDNVPERKIKASMKTKEAHFFRRGIFGKEEFKNDLERIVSVCQSLGYLDAKIVDYKLEYTHEGRLLFITIEIEEGPLYTVKEVNITGNKLFKTEELLDKLQMKENKPYNPHELPEEVNRLRNYYAQKGYIVTQIWDEPSIDRETKEVKIIYHIEEGPKTYVHLIKIRGNTKTQDKVIRRELTIKPGDEFDGDKIRRSREKLYNLGYFKEVKAYTEPTDKPEQRDLVFEVEEEKTGALTFGVGYSSMENVIGFIQLQQDNFDIRNPPYFTGGGQRIRAKARFGKIREDYILSFTEPYFLDYPLSVGFDLYDRTRDWTAYDERVQGGDIRIGKRLTDYVSLNTTYKYEVVNISDVASDASEALKEEEGKFDTSGLTVGLTRDTRDSIFIPTRGFLGNISTEYAGGFLGGDRNFTKYIGDATWFCPVVRKENYEHVVSLRLRAGIAKEFADSENVPIYERFFIGGSDTIRGYPYREVGPEDDDDNPIGGKSFFIANAEYTFPIWKRIIRGALFYDIGNAWEGSNDISFDDLVAGVGVGLRMQTPIGPVNLDYGYGIEREKWRLHFSMGYSF
jgi:outer membrane protein insertion porin family